MVGQKDFLKLSKVMHLPHVQIVACNFLGHGICHPMSLGAL